MVEKNVTIKNETGLHARPAASLVQFVKKFDESIEIILDKMCIRDRDTDG